MRNASVSRSYAVTRDEILAVIAEHTREVVPDLEQHNFNAADRLQDLGANSVDRAEIVMLVLNSLQLRIPLVDTFGPRNIGELADLLHGRRLCA
jgi:polyketide biosynthesis acyl carrier protein